MGQCIWCFNEIPLRAKICTHCMLRQSELFESGKSLITLAAIGSVLFSGLLFVRETAWGLRDARSLPRVEVMHYRNDRNALVRNSGSREIFLSHFHSYVPRINRSVTSFVGQTLRPGEVIVIDTRSTFATRIDDSEDQPIINFSPSMPDFFFDNIEKSSRLRPMIFSSEDFALVAAKNFHARQPQGQFNMLPAQCELYFSAGGKTLLRYDFNCEATVGYVGNLGAIALEIQTYAEGQ